MNKKMKFFDRISFATMILAPILTIFILAGLRSNRYRFPLPLFLKIMKYYKFVMAGFTCLFWLALFVIVVMTINQKRSIPQIIFFILSTVFGTIICFGSSFYVLSYPEKISASVELDGQHYYLTDEGTIGDQILNYYFFRCNSQDQKCEQILHYQTGYWSEYLSLEIDENNQEVLIVGISYYYGNHHLIYSYDPDNPELP